MRSAPAVALLLLATALGACAAPAPPSPTDPASPAPTPIAPRPSADPTDGDTGNVDPATPELTVERLPDGRLRIALLDPAAKAWRLTIASTERDDRWELEVTTTDVAPAILAREIRAGSLIAEDDLSAFAGEDAAATGGCHPALGVCYASNDIRLPAEGDGALGVTVELVDPVGPLTIVGATAGWPGEPFVLGSWEASEPFATD